MRIQIIATLLLTAFQYAQAVQLPRPSADDPHVGHVDYKTDDVTRIPVQRGVATRILLERDEKIATGGAGTGFPADCSKPELEWCMHADAGGNQILVKPRDGATHNNLELRTDRRDYSFEFEVVGEPPSAQRRRSGAPAYPTTALYRVTFAYPEQKTTDAAQLALALLRTARNNGAEPGETSAPPPASAPVPRNWQYSMQAGSGAEDIVPTLVFDDGRFTYFRFPANREVPTIYVVSGGGEEARVNFHMDAADADITVVERMGRRFMLRLGSAMVCIWNDAFDSYGIPPIDGTTVDGLARSIR